LRWLLPPHRDGPGLCPGWPRDFVRPAWSWVSAMPHGVKFLASGLGPSISPASACRRPAARWSLPPTRAPSRSVNVAVRADDVPGLVDLRSAQRPTSVVVGPERPLVLGVVVPFELRGFVPAGGPGHRQRSRGLQGLSWRFCDRLNSDRAVRRLLLRRGGAAPCSATWARRPVRAAPLRQAYWLAGAVRVRRHVDRPGGPSIGSCDA